MKKKEMKREKWMEEGKRRKGRSLLEILTKS
jgi:hypothetical protein